MKKSIAVFLWLSPYIIWSSYFVSFNYSRWFCGVPSVWSIFFFNACYQFSKHEKSLYACAWIANLIGQYLEHRQNFKCLLYAAKFSNTVKHVLRCSRSYDEVSTRSNICPRIYSNISLTTYYDVLYGDILWCRWA